ncbi:MAG TPA: pyridoxamine 5'-phosphate oxidase [Opitutaceae bacterium]|nr:pyridoxamine 5'-phosphate oxidase [Opitutaceae bacterium]
MDDDPLVTFHTWLDDARRAGLREPSAMALATVSAEGHPEVRMVLLKHADEHAFVFYTNLESPKAAALRAHPEAELCFYWNPPGRQVRVRGPVKPVSAKDADAYFSSRPYLSRIGAWASRQSRPLGGYAELERAVAATLLRFPGGKVPRPPHWSGFYVVPEMIELWQERPYRLHERIRFVRSGGKWKQEPLYP